MYANTRKQPKAPEINTLKTLPLAAWNTAESAAKSMDQQQSQATIIDKQQAIKEIVRKYQENQYINYMTFVGELGALGYCAMPSSIPALFEVANSECVTEKGTTHASTTYGEYKRQMGTFDDKKRGPENNLENENASKKPKYDNGHKSNRVHTGWSDEENNGQSSNRNGRKTSRVQTNSINRMPSGWSEDESDQQSRYNDRFGERRDNYQRGGWSRGRGDRGRGRGGRGFGNNDRFNNSSRSSAPIKTGWSDDEIETKKEPKTEQKSAAPTKSNDDDDWGDNNNDIKATLSRPLTPVPTKEDCDDWD